MHTLIARLPRPAKVLLPALLIALLMATGYFALGASRPAAGSDPSPAAAVAAAWQAAQERGSYRFTSDVTRVTIPEATLLNVGNRSRQEQIYLEGRTDLAAQTMDLRLWSDALANGGSVLIPDSGLEVRMAEGRTQMRNGSGPWEESGSLTDGYAPQGDFLGWLAALRDVTRAGEESSHGLDYTRYTFTIDGLAFARYSRDQMQQAMHARGELPPTMQLEISAYHAQMSGDGELWVGADGLPLRQIIRLRFPAQNDERVAAQIAVNFFDYGSGAGASLAGLLDPTTAWALLAPWLAGGMTLLFVGGGALALLLFRRRWAVQAGVALGMSILLVVSPLLSNVPVLGFLDRQAAQAAESEAAQAEVDVAESLRAIAAESTFDPHANRMDRLAAASQANASVVDQPDVSPLTNPQCPNPNEPDTDKDGVNDCLETKVWKTDPGKADTDGDGLSDFQEIGLGTDPRSNDSDNDGLLDKAEIDGFTANGMTWRTDPVQADTNQDGLADLIERGPTESPTVAADTDGDGTPDLFDTDNDNDGVPDGTDLSPFTVAPANHRQSPYGAGNPLQVTLSGIENGRKAFLDLQLRPAITDHLRYAYTVLDWPADRKGQVQDWDNATYAQNLVNRGDIASTAYAAASDNYGDMRLTPSLEISIDGAGGANLAQYHLPSEAELLPYNINVVTNTVDGTPYGTPNGITLYVPLNLVTDPRTGTRTAFRARIPYLGAGGAWNVPHKVRMVWTVQALQDIPCDPTDERAKAYGCRTLDGSNPFLFHIAAGLAGTLDSESASDALKTAFANAGRPLVDKITITALGPGSFWQISDKSHTYVLRLKNGQIQVNAGTPGVIYNQSQIVQRYEDDWFLTGANLTEDRGVEVGIFYEDPSLDPDIQSDDALWALAYGLEDTFLSPTDTKQANQRDTTLNDLYNRFNHTSNGDNPTARWGIPDILTVKRSSYATQDWAVASVSMTTTQQTLKAFDAQFQSAGPITPTLLYAQETTYRGVGLDDLRAGGGYVSTPGSGLSINLSGLQPTIVHSAKWTSFCAAPGAQANAAPTWRECEQAAYLGNLASRYRDYLHEAGDTEARLDGRVVSMQLYYTSLWQGVSVTAQSGGKIVKEVSVPPSDAQLAGQLQSANGVKGGAAKVADIIIRQMFLNVDDVLETIGTSRLSVMAKLNNDANAAVKKLTHSGKIQEAWSGIDYNGVKSRKTRAGALASIAAVGFGLLAKFIWPESTVAQGVSAGTALVVLNVYLGLYKPLMQAKALASVTSWSAVLRGNAALAGASSKATAIGTAIAIAVAWGFFIGSMLDSGTKFGSPAFNAGLAAVLALTIYLVVLAVLSASVVGLLIVGLLAAIDGLFTLICAVAGDGAKDALGAKDGDCTVGTKIVTALTGYLYARDMMIETDAEKNPKLLDQAAPVVELQTPGLGYIAGNRLDVTVPVTTNIVHKNPDNWNVFPYIPSFFNESRFRSTTFRYTLSQEKAAFEVDRYAMSNEWKGLSAESATDYGIPWQKLRAYAFQQPKLTGVKLSAGINQPIDYWFNMAYALPAYECWTIIYVPYCEVQTERGGEPSFVNGPSYDIFPDTVGQFFNTSGSAAGRRLAWDSRFPTIWDADGDGLVSGEKGGIDPNDDNPDSDGDGLTDRFEMEQRLEGVRLSPVDPDTDSDGLTDGQEVQFGTNPANADTDNDGLKDGEEVYHQVFQVVGNRLEPVLENGKPKFEGGWEILSPLAGQFITSTNPSLLRVWVSSDPTQADPDNDGIPDDAERRLAQLGQLDPAGQPYHPLVANVNPLQLFVSASVPPDSYLRPGQSFAYTNTLVSYTALDPGVLQLSVPGVLGGATEVVAFNASPNITATVARTYQVNPGAGSQPFSIESTARARLQKQSSAPTFAFNVSDGANLGQVSGGALFARGPEIATVRPDRPDSYVLGALISRWSARGSKGNVEAYELGGGTPTRSLDGDWATIFGENNLYRRGQSAPGTACNDKGDCFVVWDRVDNCNTFSVHRLDVDQKRGDGHNGFEWRGIEPVLYYFPDTSQSGWGYEAGRVLWSADESYPGKDMDNGDWAGGAVGSAVHNGLPVYEYLCNTGDTANGFAQIWAMESDGNFKAGDKWPDGTCCNLWEPNKFTVRLDRMESQVYQLGDWDGADVIRVHIDMPKKQRNTIIGSAFGSTVGAAAQRTLAESLGASGVNVGDFMPVVASDGDGFLVVWNRKIASYSAPNWDIASYILSRRFDAGGVATGPVTVIWTKNYQINGSGDFNNYGFVNYDAAFAHTETDLIPNVIWAGDRYRVVFALPGTPTVNLLYQDIFTNSSTSINALFSSNLPQAVYNRTIRPEMAYDPVNRRILLVYQTLDRNVAGLLSTLANDTSTVIPSLGSMTQAGTVARPTVGYYPAIGGWLVAYKYTESDFANVYYAALKADGAPFDSSLPGMYDDWPTGQTLQPNGLSLMCPSPFSAPVAAFPFEEMPGSLTFSNVSGYPISDAHCDGNNCPLAGIAGVGAPNQSVADSEARPPRTDRALLFDGVNDDVTFKAPAAVADGFTYSFWFKPDPAQVHPNTTNWWEGTPLLLANANSFEQIYGVSIGAGNRILIGQGSATAASPSIPADEWDKWHHVVFLRRPRNNGVVLYLDGQGITGNSNANAPVASPQVYLGTMNGRYYRGALDFLTVYATDLAGDAINSLYKGELQNDLGYSLNPSYCVFSGGAYKANDESGFPWTKIAIQRTLPRGEGPLTAQDGLSLRVDAVRPTSSIDSLASVEYLKGPPSTRAGLATETLIIGGNASDADSGIAYVDVLVNGTPARADGQSTWTFPFVYGAEGHYTLQSRAVDNVGFVESNGPQVTLIVDSTPPVTALANQQLTAKRSESGRWAFPVGGSISDPAIGASPGSGVDRNSLQVIVQKENGEEVAVQPAQLSGANWSSLVEFPSATADPSGLYTVTLRYADSVGNRGEVKAGVRLDVPRAGAGIDPASQVIDFITGPTAASSARMKEATVSLSGEVESALGISAVEGAFVPIGATTVLSDAVMILHLDEPAGEVWFQDATLNNNSAHCGIGAYECPVAGQPGRLDRGLTYNRKSLVEVPHTADFYFDQSVSFTAQMWVYPTKDDAQLFGKDDGKTGFRVNIEQGGRLSFKLYGQNNSDRNLTTPNGTTVALNEWHHIAVSLDKHNEKAFIYLDGAEAASMNVPATMNISNETPIRIGSGFAGVIDQVIISRRALDVGQIRDAMSISTIVWHPAGFSKTSGGETPSAPVAGKWSLPIPAGLENLYQFDLRVTDSTGKRFRRPNLWRGTIDNLPPRIAVDAGATGNFYNDTATGSPRYDIDFSNITAEDLNLASLTTPCGATYQPSRSYVDSEWSRRFFPDGTLTNRLTAQCHLWAAGENPVYEITACDDFGQCATASQTVSTARVARRADGTADPILIWPPAGSVVAMSGNSLDIQMGTTSAGALKEMGVMVNGQAAEMVNWTQQQNVTQAQETISFGLPAGGEGVYNLSVRTTAWDGTVINGPVSRIVLDTQDPVGSLITDKIGVADSYSAQNGIVRLQGTAGDSMGDGNIANVEMSIDGGPFQDVTWHGDGSWSTARYLGVNPYGKTVQVTTRVTDKAGRVTTATKSVLVDIPAPAGFDPAAIPGLSIDDAGIVAGLNTATIAIRLSSPLAYGTVSVGYTTQDGSATAGQDYTATSGTAVIRAGESSTTISIPILNNGGRTSHRVFSVQLVNPVNASISDGTGRVEVGASAPVASPTPTITPTPTATPTPLPGAVPNLYLPSVSRNSAGRSGTEAEGTPTATPTATPTSPAMQKEEGGASIYLPGLNR